MNAPSAAHNVAQAQAEQERLLHKDGVRAPCLMYERSSHTHTPNCGSEHCCCAIEGGDLDGDHVMVCFWRKFVAIMERMQPSVARLEALLKLYEQDVLEAVVSRRTAWASAAVQQRGHSLKTFDLARQQPPPVGYPPSVSTAL